MRIARIVNAVPNNHSNETNNDSEPNIAVNPANPSQMAITAFTPPDSGLTNGPIYYTTDGGENWSLLFDVPGNGSQDQTIAYASSSGELYMATLRADTSPITLNVDRSSDPTSGVFPSSIDTRTKLDQPWVHAITVPSGANAGKVCTYVGYGDQTSGYWATVDFCLDALAASPSFTQVKLNPRTAQRDGFHIRTKPHSDGTVYVGYQSWQSTSGNNVTMNMMVARDDNWGNNSFGDLTDPSDTKAGRIVASVTIDESTALGGQRPDNGFDLQVDPNDSDVVYICWIDNGGSGFRLHVRRSVDRGQNWSSDLITVDNAALATMAVNSQSTVALAYLELVSSQWDTHFQTTSDGTTWDDLQLARTATNGFIGDYMRMVAVGPHFYGVFPAVNTPTSTNFFPNGGGTTRFQRNNNGTSLLGTDNTTTVSSSTDPFFFKVEEKDVTFVLNRDPIGQDEVDARRLQPHGSTGGLPIQDAFRVIVDGFTAAELGLTGPSSTLGVNGNLSNTIMPITCTGNTSDTGDYGTEVQRFTFYYSVDFDAADDAFSFITATFDVALSATAGPVTGYGLLTLIKQPDPFMLHGDPSWLSVDLRFVVARQGQAMYGVSGITDASDAPRFVQQLIGAITAAQFDALPSGEDDTKLYTQPDDEHSVPVFNLALAKVHYIGLIGAHQVRVFFRLFQAQTTTSTYDYPPGAQYRRATSNPDGQPIPLAGILGPEYVTIPFFAAPRVDTTSVSMDQQTDDPYNVQDITAHSDGSEVDKIFGCWLDINQPFKPDGVTPNNVLPVLVPPAQDGPFNPSDLNPFFRPVPIAQAISRALHQCLIAEVAFDPTPIPIGKDTSNWDKLAQRNIAWADVNSALAGTTFEIRPTAASLPAWQTPDELMIDWNNTPAGGEAAIYLPQVGAADVLAMADRMYATHKLSHDGEHTIHCKTGGITYVPIPPGGPVNYAGLLTVDVDAAGRRGEIFNVVVRQLTNAFGRAEPPPPPPPPNPRLEARQRTAVQPDAFVRNEIEWRRVIGAFQLSIPVKNKEALLVREERDLSVLRWIAEAIPHTSRWYPVFLRYLKLIGGRVGSFGGDPGSITPSPTGGGVPKHPGHPGHPGHPPHHGPGHHHHGDDDDDRRFTGKIASLIFDRFGDFVGFVLQTDRGDHRFLSREDEIEHLAEQAWRERLRISVIADYHDPDRIEHILIYKPPAPFSG
ncbi:MAG: hypothetical protein WA814_02055 [Candidatus Baltobacteraceae bacterium]